MLVSNSPGERFLGTVCRGGLDAFMATQKEKSHQTRAIRHNEHTTLATSATNLCHECGHNFSPLQGTRTTSVSGTLAQRRQKERVFSTNVRYVRDSSGTLRTCVGTSAFATPTATDSRRCHKHRFTMDIFEGSRCVWARACVHVCECTHILHDPLLHHHFIVDIKANINMIYTMLTTSIL